MRIKVGDLRQIIKEEIQSARQSCNCESESCSHRPGECRGVVDKRRAMYVGLICNACASKMPKEYLIDDVPGE